MAERPGGARDKEDKELVLAFQGGEKSAYDALYRRHARRVGAICLRILNNRDDAEEATQETFLRAYEALSRFNGEYRVGAWLNRIATNVCLDGLRRRANSPQALASDPPDGLPTPEAVAERGGFSRAMERLPPRHASVIRLRAVEDLTYHEMAERLEMSPSQVKSLLFRARASLRRALSSVEGWAMAPFGALLRAPVGEKLAAERVTAVAALTVMSAASPAATSSATTAEAPQAQRPAAVAGAYPAPTYRSLPAPSRFRKAQSRPTLVLATPQESVGGKDRPRHIDEDQAAPGGPVDDVLEDVRSLSAAVDGITHGVTEGVADGVDGVVHSVEGRVDEVVNRVEGVEIAIDLPLLKGHSSKEPEEEP
jgi:RNA polymerase sigma-70 factor (ECF subfamily)